ncbi:MAG TPA: hypothetical protein VNK46_11395 [Nitrospiraceae bacterium]|jgi:hypothetical protein|nr:hypothetical protein [Nitrospiraceae bacterium]
MLLPLHPRRAWLQSFWIVMCSMIGLLAGGCLAARLGTPWIATGVLAGVLLSYLGFLVPTVARGPYRLWFRVTDLYFRIVRLAVKAACFFLIFVIVGRRKSSLLFDRPTEMASIWGPRNTLPDANYPHEYEGETGGAKPRAWVSVYLSWARSTGNGWAIGLLPFLLLLSLLEPEQERVFPAGIYTLF